MTEMFFLAMEDTSACDRVWKMYRKLTVSLDGANKVRGFSINRGATKENRQLVGLGGEPACPMAEEPACMWARTGMHCGARTGMHCGARTGMHYYMKGPLQLATG